ncbi:MAG: hypothetical protein HQK97_09615 [Nitrospirae bacterium]|nr:hypothetical protein [Nitrospirota bacterium]
MDIGKLRRQIKRNCDISDAKYWGFYSICGMLLRIRLLYRQVHALAPWDAISNDLILPWIAQQEAMWEQLEDEGFDNLTINGVEFQPFDSEAINSILTPHGHLYGAGVGIHGKPTFFLGRLLKISSIGPCTVYYVDEELERDLFASPAMIRGRHICIRLQPFYDILYDKVSTPKGRQHDPLLAEVIEDLRLKDITEDYCHRFKAFALDVSTLLLHHEAAEFAEDGDGSAVTWLEIISGTGNRFVEIYLRAMKDVLADTSELGPLRHIIDTRDTILLSFYTALMDNVRLEIFPEITAAYREFAAGSHDWQSIEQARAAGYARALRFRQDILSLWADKQEIEPHIRRFLTMVKAA